MIFLMVIIKGFASRKAKPRQRSHTCVVPRRRIDMAELAKKLSRESICRGNSMKYEVLFYGDYTFLIPFALAMFPDKVWNNDWFETTVPITALRIYSN